ncbi:MAG: hypothetical protein QXD61_11800 [Candidatus Caldarchaeum sp.]
MPRKTYREGRRYYGTFPEGFLKRLKALGVWREPVVDLTAGENMDVDVRLDINPMVRPDAVCDSTRAPLRDGFAGLVLLDPYYSDEDYAKVGLKPFKFYRFVDEACRIVRPGGYVAILHQRNFSRKKHRDHMDIVAFIPISVGPDRLLRILQVWRKKPLLSSYFESDGFSGGAEQEVKQYSCQKKGGGERR